MRKIFMKIGIIILLSLVAYACAPTQAPSANEIDKIKYCYTNQHTEMLRDKNTMEKSAIVSPDLTLVKTYDDGEWAYVYYNHGQCHGWMKSDHIDDGSKMGREDVYIKPLKSIGTFKVTGYTCSPKENGGYSVTCTGVRLKDVIGKCVAADKKVIPLGTKIYIDGIGYRTVMDTGVKGRVLDVLTASNRASYAITGNYKVYIVG